MALLLAISARLCFGFFDFGFGIGFGPPALAGWLVGWLVGVVAVCGGCVRGGFAGTAGKVTRVQLRLASGKVVVRRLLASEPLLLLFAAAVDALPEAKTRPFTLATPIAADFKLIDGERERYISNYCT